MVLPVSQVQEQARWLSQQYAPWCLLHMLLKNHSSLFSIALLEELLPPFSPDTPYSNLISHSPPPPPSSSSPSPLPPLPSSHGQCPPHSSQPAEDKKSPTLLRPEAVLSRYLIQRLHFGYYGNRATLSEATVRYLTARARLEFGYFVIRGRAFWSITPSDLEEEPFERDLSMLPASRERDGKSGARAGGTQDSQQRRNRRQQQQQQQQQQARQGESQGQDDENDPSNNKDEEPLAIQEASTDIGGRQGSAGSENKSGPTSEEERRQRIVKGNQQCEEREEQLLMLEAVRYIERRRPDLMETLVWELAPKSQSPSKTLLSNTANPASESATSTPPVSDRHAAAVQWRRVAMTRLIESLADIAADELSNIPSSPFLNRRVDSRWMDHLQRPPTSPITLKDTRHHNQPYGGMCMVQDDARLFQIASGFFEDLKTYPRKWKKPVHDILDGPLSNSYEIVRNLVLEYGYMPLPDDDADRRMHHTGGDRALTGVREVFPSDGSLVVNRREQRGEGTSIWYYYDLQRIEVMAVFLMYRSPEVLDWLFQRGFEFIDETGPKHLGISRALVLQCCLPSCHSMVRHVYQSVVSDAIYKTVHNELLGYGEKPVRIEFRHQDFAEVLKGVASTHLLSTLSIMSQLGMENAIVQRRLIEVLQIPGGLAPVNVEDSILFALFHKCASESLTAATEVVNLAIQQSFEIQMDPPQPLDLEWKRAFEDALLNLKKESLIVHPNVSDWIISTLDPAQPAFQVCFDHAFMEALLGIAEWNMTQVRRLRKWSKSQERNARIRSVRTGRHWEEIKKQLIVVGNEDSGEDSSMLSSGERRRIGLDIEWTTNDEIIQTPSTNVASLSKGSEMVRMSDDGCLLLDNGCLDQTLLHCGLGLEEDSVLDTNIRVYGYLRRGAIVEDKHWTWLATGLVAISLQGLRATDIPESESPPGVSHSIPVQMACSPEAYQLMWMVASVFVRQFTQAGGEDRAFNSSHAADPAADQGQYKQDNPSSSTTSSSASPPPSPVPLPTCAIAIRNLQMKLISILGPDARLLVEILTEIESEMEEE